MKRLILIASILLLVACSSNKIPEGFDENELNEIIKEYENNIKKEENDKTIHQENLIKIEDLSDNKIDNAY